MGTAVRAWLGDVREAFRTDLGTGLQLAAYYLYVGLWLTLSTRIRFGTPIYERDWDLLVVLDACRTDALAAVADEYDFLEDRDAIYSMGSTSSEWVAHSFDSAYAAEIDRTAYVTANPHSEEVLRRQITPPQYVATPFTWPDWDPVDPDAFAVLEEVWVDGRDDRLNVVPPATVTDRAIAIGRESAADRMVVHYMQPHAPYIAETVDGTGALPADRAAPFDALRRGDTDRATVWEQYLDNLRLVLDEVADLLENVDADRVVVTADHGEAFGEWGFYEHPVGCPHPAVRRVPWVETTAIDRGTRNPDAVTQNGMDRDGAAADVETQLRDLGYR
jgi:hypothetical protein